MQCPKCNYEYLTEELEKYNKSKNEITVHVWCKNCGFSIQRTLDIRKDFKNGK
jgi:transcription elongation factor Elf1